MAGNREEGWARQRRIPCCVGEGPLYLPLANVLQSLLPPNKGLAILEKELTLCTAGIRNSPPVKVLIPLASIMIISTPVVIYCASSSVFEREILLTDFFFSSLYLLALTFSHGESQWCCVVFTAHVHCALSTQGCVILRRRVRTNNTQKKIRTLVAQE